MSKFNAYKWLKEYKSKLAEATPGDDVLDLQSILQSYVEEVERVLAEVNELEQFVAGGIDSYEQETGDLRISQLRNQSARYIQSAETNLVGLSKALKRAQKGNA